MKDFKKRTSPMPAQVVPLINFTMSDDTHPVSTPVVTLTLEPSSRGQCPEISSPAFQRTKRHFLSSIKKSPSMLRRRIKPPLLNTNQGSNLNSSWDGSGSTGVGGAGLSSPSSKGTKEFTNKDFHVKYQGHTRVTTLQVSEAMQAVKKLAPELLTATTPSSASSSTEDLMTATSARSSSPTALPRSSSPTQLPGPPKSPRLSRSKAFFRTCCLSVSKQCICIYDEERLFNETIPIATVAYCATDLRHPRTVALICKAPMHSSTLLCHVFVCYSKEKAEKIVAFVAKAFQSAWDDCKATFQQQQQQHQQQQGNANSPASLSVVNNNNYERALRVRSATYDSLTTNLGETAPRERHSSYDPPINPGDDYKTWMQLT